MGRNETWHAGETATFRGGNVDKTTTKPNNSVTRKRGAWTKDEPYTRKDGTATRGTTIYLPVELAERLRRFAFEQDRKQNAIITDAIEAYLLRRDA
jgi:hypothetical protein